MLEALRLQYRRRRPPGGDDAPPDGHPRRVIYETRRYVESPGERIRRIVDEAALRVDQPVGPLARAAATEALETFVANESASYLGPRVAVDDLELILIAIAVLEVL